MVQEEEGDSTTTHPGKSKKYDHNETRERVNTAGASWTAAATTAPVGRMSATILVKRLLKQGWWER